MAGLLRIVPTDNVAIPSAWNPWHLSVRVLIAITLGMPLGTFDPALAAQMKPLGGAYIAVIRMVIAPIIFHTVVHGIAGMDPLKGAGRVGLNALIYSK